MNLGGKQVPGRGGIFILAQELRRVGLTHAQLDVESLKDDESLEGLIVKSDAHDATRASHDRDFRTLGFFPSSVLNELKTGCIRIFDIVRGPIGYEVSVHLFSNEGCDDGISYIDLIAHRHHMRWGKLVNDIRGKDVTDWKEHFSSAAHYPIRRWVEFGETRTESGITIPGACLYCKKKVKIPAEVPWLQAPHHCGGRRRNSMGAEGNHWLVDSSAVTPIPTSLSWTPCPDSPLSVGDDLRVDLPPSFSPPLRSSQPESILEHRAATISRWKRNDHASFPLISFNWRYNLSKLISYVAL